MTTKRYNEAIDAINYVQKTMLEEGIKIEFCETQSNKILEDPILTALALKKLKLFENALEKILNISNAYLEAKTNEANEISEEEVDFDIFRDFE